MESGSSTRGPEKEQESTDTEGEDEIRIIFPFSFFDSHPLKEQVESSMERGVLAEITEGEVEVPATFSKEHIRRVKLVASAF
jgi:hypothetical protein